MSCASITEVANREIPYQAAVNAVWLAEGSIEEAAKLLRAPVEDLMRAIGTAEGPAMNAFCGRPIEWQPEDSLRSAITDTTWLELGRAVMAKINTVHPGSIWVGDVYDVAIVMRERLHELMTERSSAGIVHVLGPTPVENTRPISVRQSGMDAFRAGHALDQNPWEKGKIEWELWRSGWFTAESDAVLEQEV